MSLIVNDTSEASLRKLQLSFDGMDDLTNASALYRLQGKEGISRPYTYRLSFYSSKLNLNPMDLIGLGVKFGVAYPFQDGDNVENILYRHGLVRNVSVGPTSSPSTFLTRVRSYTLEVVPWFSFLKRSRHRRIFEHKSVCEILAEILDDYPALSTEHEILLPTDNYKTYEVRTQFDESDFDFLSRILADEGVYYYFKHEDIGSSFGHKMVVADRANQYMQIDYPTTIGFNAQSDSGAGGMGIHQWEYDYDFQPQAFVERDYDFSRDSPEEQAICSQSVIKPEFVPTPFSEADTGDSNPDYPMFSVHEYGRHLVRNLEPVGLRLYPRSTQGEEGLSDRRMAELESHSVMMHGEGTVSTFIAGGKFAFHPGLAEFTPDDSSSPTDSRYVITWLYTEAQLTLGQEGQIEPGFRNRFRCQDTQMTRFWPSVDRRPSVVGPQTAIVVDSDGKVDPERNEPILDQFGRVRVRFHWDAASRASCWVRVSQSWAGPQHGAMMFPLVGHEVLVEFIDGNPDRPVITGRVYNAHNQHPMSMKDDDRDRTGRQMMIRDPLGDYLRMQAIAEEPQILFHTVAASDKLDEDANPVDPSNGGGSTELTTYLGYAPDNTTLDVPNSDSSGTKTDAKTIGNGVYFDIKGALNTAIGEDLLMDVEKSAYIDFQDNFFLKNDGDQAIRVGGNQYVNIVGEQLTYINSDRADSDTSGVSTDVALPSGNYTSYTNINGPAYLSSGYSADDNTSNDGYVQVTHGCFDLEVYGDYSVTSHQDTWNVTHGNQHFATFGNVVDVDFGANFNSFFGISLEINVAIEIASKLLELNLARFSYEGSWLKIENFLMESASSAFDLNTTSLNVVSSEMTLKQSLLHLIL